MKKFPRSIKIFLLVLFLLSHSLLAGMPVNAWSGMTISKLHVSGNQLVNSSGQPVTLSGWHQPTGAYWTYQNSTYYLKLNNNNRHAAILAYLKDITDTFTSGGAKYGSSHGWYMNQCRLFIDREDMGDVAAGTYNFAGLQSATQNIIIPYINYARTKGVYVTLGLDFTLANNQCTTQDNLDKFNQIWGYLASQPAIKSADNVMFELINEPISSYANGHWGGYAGESDYAAHWDALKTFQNSIISTIRKQGADNVIWAAGLGYDQTYNLCASKPITDPLNNYGYAVHWYPGYGANNDLAALKSIWNNDIAPCAAAYPINITETCWFKNKTGDSSYWSLFNGSSEGFGKNTKSIFTTAGNVSIAAHMNGFILEAGTRSTFADPTAGLKWDGDTTRDAMARFIFEWYYERAQAYPNSGISNGIVSGAKYKIINRGSGKVIDVPGGQDVNGLQLQQYKDIGSTAQQWIVTDMGNGNYRLKSVCAANKVIDVNNGTSNDGEKIQLCADYSTTAQRFKIYNLGNGYCSIINLSSNKCIDITGSSTSDYAKVEQYSYFGNYNQQWQFVRVD